MTRMPGRAAKLDPLGSDPTRLLGSALFLALYFALYWNAHSPTPICFDDCKDYVALMGDSILSGSYWQILMRPHRPVSIPIIYSLFGSPTPEVALNVVRFQIILSFLAWTTFSLSVASLADGPVARGVIFVVTSTGMFARGYYHFNQYLLSDSIALSSLLLWFAILVRGQNCVAWLAAKSAVIRALGLVAFIVLTGLVSNTRDTHIFFYCRAIPSKGAPYRTIQEATQRR